MKNAVHSTYLVSRLKDFRPNMYSYVKFRRVMDLILSRSDSGVPTIVDLGCANKDAKRYLDYFATPIRYIGLDREASFSPDIVIDIRELASIRDKLPSNPDIILVLDVLEHLEGKDKDIQATLQGIRAVAGTSTTIIFVLPSMYRLDRFKLSHLHYPEHKVRFRPKEWRERLEENGNFRVVDHYGLGVLSVIPYLSMALRGYTDQNFLGKIFRWLRDVACEWPGAKILDYWLTRFFGSMMGIRGFCNAGIWVCEIPAATRNENTRSKTFGIAASIASLFASGIGILAAKFSAVNLSGSKAAGCVALIGAAICLPGYFKQSRQRTIHPTNPMIFISILTFAIGMVFHMLALQSGHPITVTMLERLYILFVPLILCFAGVTKWRSYHWRWLIIGLAGISFWTLPQLTSIDVMSIVFALLASMAFAGQTVANAHHSLADHSFVLLFFGYLVTFVITYFMHFFLKEDIAFTMIVEHWPNVLVAAGCSALSGWLFLISLRQLGASDAAVWRSLTPLVVGLVCVPWYPVTISLTMLIGGGLALISTIKVAAR